MRWVVECLVRSEVFTRPETVVPEWPRGGNDPLGFLPEPSNVLVVRVSEVLLVSGSVSVFARRLRAVTDGVVVLHGPHPVVGSPLVAAVIGECLYTGG